MDHFRGPSVRTLICGALITNSFLVVECYRVTDSSLFDLEPGTFRPGLMPAAPACHPKDSSGNKLPVPLPSPPGSRSGNSGGEGRVRDDKYGNLLPDEF